MNSNIKYNSIIEAILYLKGDEGIMIDKLANLINLSIAETAQEILNLSLYYEKNIHGLEILFEDGNIRFTTKKVLYPYIIKMIDTTKSKKLSTASLEVLAIIAYNSDKKITRGQVNRLRGVNSDSIINNLCLHDLIEYGPKQYDLPGNPITLKVTKKFLNSFNISSLKDLPELPEIENLNDSDNNIFDLNNISGNFQEELKNKQEVNEPNDNEVENDLTENDNLQVEDDTNDQTIELTNEIKNSLDESWTN